MSLAPDRGDDLLRRILAETRTIAVVGASSNPMRASNHVMAYLQAKGYYAIPVNPNELGRKINGERVYARLADLAMPIDLIDVFRNSRNAADVVEEVLAVKDKLGIRAIWMQLGVRNDAAARRAEAAGLDVVMDRCPKIEIPRLFGAAPPATATSVKGG
jgi:predicted CoA-binding protein